MTVPKKYYAAEREGRLHPRTLSLSESESRDAAVRMLNDHQATWNDITFNFTWEDMEKAGWVIAPVCVSLDPENTFHPPVLSRINQKEAV